MSIGSRILLLLLALAALAGAGVGVVLWTAARWGRNQEPAARPFVSEPASGRINILLLGVDKKGTTHDRTDVIILIGLDGRRRSLSLLSIPRDTFVHVAGLGYTKINHAHAYGGIALTLRTIQEFLGVPVNYYVEINYPGFVRLVNMLGGIWIDNPRAFQLSPDFPSKDKSFPQGRIHLDGQRALDYTRFRGDPEGDIGRLKRGHVIIRALVDRVNDPVTVFRAPFGLSQLGGDVKTNMTAGDMTRVLFTARWIGARGLASPAMVPGYPRLLHDPVVEAPLSFWVPDMSRTDRLVETLFPEVPGRSQDRASYRTALIAASARAEAMLPPDTLGGIAPPDSGGLERQSPVVPQGSSSLPGDSLDPGTRAIPSQR
jgi:LCP family protein required for cell wall assembly